MATEAQCKQALDQYEEQLGTRKNVVGLGIVPLEEENKLAGRRGLAVGVYVKKKVALDRLAAKDRLPEELEVKQRSGVVKVPIKVIEQGEVQLQQLG